MSLTILVTNPSADLYGSSRMVLESMQGFREEGWSVTLTIPTRGPLADRAEATEVAFDQCPTPTLRKGDLSPIGVLRLSWRTLQAIPPGLRLLRQVRPDVVYVSTITTPLWMLLPRLLRVPVVCHVHEGESGASPLVRRLLALPLLFARCLVVNSRFSMGVLVDAIPRLGRRCRVVYNGVASPAESPAPRVALEPPVRLLYVGRLSERKGVADAVDAVAELADLGVDAELEIVGSAFAGYEAVETGLPNQAAARGVRERVHLRGFDPDVWPHLAAADILLVPSRMDEPFGNTAVEGLLAARPVVATCTGGLPEATADMASATLVRPADPAAIAAAVADMVAQWSEVRLSASRDAERAKERFAPATYRASVSSVIRQSLRAR